MGGCISLPCDFVCQWLCVKESYIHNLEENLAALETTMEELKAKRDDLSSNVKREEDIDLRRLEKIQVGLTRFETIDRQVKDLLSVKNTEIQRLCLCGVCSKSLIKSYRYGKRVFMMLKEVQNLRSDGAFEVVAETMLETAWNRLMGNGVGILGLYGMGGVGKTTLLKQINNKFDTFDIVIWVVVSKDLHIQKIQEDIAKKLGLAGDNWNKKDKDHKACDIHDVLRRKKFVLLLDDIWEKVDLTKIGVSFPTRENGSKVVFTTRSQEVCWLMGADVEMEVQCLRPDDALDLFQKKVGESTLGSHPNIPELAMVVAKKCHGLPLALNVIGEAMSCKRTIQEWRHAIDVLSSNAAEFSEMDKILPILKYSYDNIKGEHVKSCLLYCTLFPEDGRIKKRELIEYWICEGIIDGSGGMERDENKGYEIIGSLVRSSLLMEDTDTNTVYMHDVVREMALWIASDFGKQKDQFIVCAGAGLHGIPKFKNWNGVRRMSLISNKIDRISGSPECLQLNTLLLQSNKKLVNISGEFFRSMPRLLVLNLSWNHDLSELPDGISELVSLKYLNVSHTKIEFLPVGLQELKNLIHLDLECTWKLLSIVGISALLNLKILKLLKSGVCNNPKTVEEVLILEHLEILTIGIGSDSGLVQFLSSCKLVCCTQFLDIKSCQLESSDIWRLASMEKVCKLGMYGMGGVGKTTLLKQINNKFDTFDIVIWVVVSKDLHIQKIQEDIAKKLGLAGDNWNQKDEEQKACDIHNVLRRKKFVLLLDDIWAKVDLMKIGVPFPSRENGSKVVFTTRSQEVCWLMGADVEMEVQCLRPDDALDLFQKKVGESTLGSHPNIPELAMVVAKKCHGLPLALNVIGEAMSCKRTIQEWRHAIDVLSSNAAEFSEMDKILPILKYSYDNIKGEHVKSCLLYCALFPEDGRIKKRELIEYWIYEGIIDGSGGMERAENKGYEIIGTLVRSSLLMEETDEESMLPDKVYMHDVVREMALWIASDFGKQKEQFIVFAGAGLYEIPKVKNWNGVRRMSLMSNKIDRISGSPECLQLTTLLLQSNKTLVNISGEFFRSMPRLLVLDLSRNDLLSELPDGISKLVSLKYLNVSYTDMKFLPVGLQELKNLIHLNLEWTEKLSSIVGISALLNLKILKLLKSGVNNNPKTVEEVLILEHLEILTIGITDSGLDQFLSSHKLMCCTQFLEINGLILESSDIWRLVCN